MTTEILKQFFSERPQLSIHGFAKEAGVSTKLLDFIVHDKRSLTPRVANLLLPVMERYGYTPPEDYVVGVVTEYKFLFERWVDEIGSIMYSGHKIVQLKNVDDVRGYSFFTVETIPQQEYLTDVFDAAVSRIRFL